MAIRVTDRLSRYVRRGALALWDERALRQTFLPSCQRAARPPRGSLSGRPAERKNVRIEEVCQKLALLSRDELGSTQSLYRADKGG